MEEQHFPYKFSLSDSNNLTTVTVAALTQLSEIHLSNVQLPDLSTEEENKWRVFAANYSFLQQNLSVPGSASISVVAGEEEVLDFLSQPVIFSLSINNITSLANNTSTIITFPHNGVGFTLSSSPAPPWVYILPRSRFVRE